jgi:hypothetical protein
MVLLLLGSFMRATGFQPVALFLDFGLTFRLHSSISSTMP